MHYLRILLPTLCCLVFSLPTVGNDDQTVKNSPAPVPPTKKNGEVPEQVRKLAPLFLKWAMENAKFPGQPEDKEYRYPDTKHLRSVLDTVSAKVIYVSWDARGDEGPKHFQWKYDIASGEVKPLTAEDRRTIETRWQKGELTVAEQAHFRLQKPDRGVLCITFKIGQVHGDFRLRQEEKRFVLVEKPALLIR